MSVPTEVLVQRLCEAAHTVGHARHAVPAHWQDWHQLLWQIQWVLANAAEQIHADQTSRELAQARWEQMSGFAQGWWR
jgi:hypothetical protein